VTGRGAPSDSGDGAGYSAAFWCGEGLSRRPPVTVGFLRRPPVTGWVPPSLSGDGAGLLRRTPVTGRVGPALSVDGEGSPGALS
jgi:hypothetical protein